MSRLDNSERRIPQDGRIKLQISKRRAIDFRVSSCPTLFGEKIVLRILDPTSATLGIDTLGYEPDQKQLYHLDALSKPYGMILVTGPTGSGKTVSLYTGLNILNTANRNISTAEDPARSTCRGSIRSTYNRKSGSLSRPRCARFCQGSNVIMVGEIRDLKTAEIAIKAAQTGHLVLSTCIPMMRHKRSCGWSTWACQPITSQRRSA